MNVNGSRFDLLLGRDDWGRCLDGDGGHARTLGEWWSASVDDPALALPSTLPDWDGPASEENRSQGELRIRPVRIDLPSTAG